MKKLWIITEYYYPELNKVTGYYLTEIAESLSSVYEVHVMSALSDEYAAITTGNRIVHHGVSIQYINSPALNKNILFQRLIKLIYLSAMFFLGVLRNVRSGDKVIVVTNPAFMPVFISAVKKMIRIEYYLLIHDVFPENLAALSLLDRNGLRFKILKYIFDWSYEKADQIIVLGRDMYDVVKRKNKKENVTVITNWSQNDALYPENKTNNRLVTEWGLTTKFIVQYAGNIGWAQGIENILQAIKYIDDPDVHFVFIGEGAKLADLLMFKKENPERLTYVKTMPRELQHLFLNACDVSLVCLASGYYGLGVPSKTYNLLAVGKPILLVSEANTEIELTIKEEHVGLFVEANNPEKLADAILRLKNDRALYDSLKRNCIKTANSRFSKKNVLNKYIELLHE